MVDVKKAIVLLVVIVVLYFIVTGWLLKGGKSGQEAGEKTIEGTKKSFNPALIQCQNFCAKECPLGECPENLECPPEMLPEELSTDPEAKKCQTIYDNFAK